MKVILLFFGATAAVVGERRVEISLPYGVTSNIAFNEIKNRFPKLNDLKLQFSVNQTYATGEEVVGDGDELAIFTAVSGG